MPNSEFSLPEKDSEKTLNYELMPRSMLDFPYPDDSHGYPNQEEDQKREKEALDSELQEQDFEEREKEGGNKFERSTFDIRIICFGENYCKIDEACRTPASVDELKIELRETNAICCPSTPKKPKTAPSRKRSWGGRAVLLDVSKEVDSMFPPKILEGFGKKIKKARS